MSRPPATSRKLRRVLVLLALFLLCLRAVQTARALLGAEAVPFPRSVPPGIWARNLLVARRAKVDGTLDRGEAEGNENDKGPREDDNENKDEQLQENKEAPAKESELTFKNYDEQMVGKLRELCRARGLPSNGTKAELKAALAKDDEERRPVEAKAASAAVPTGVPVRQRRIWLQQEGNPYSVFLDMDAIVDDLRHLATPDVSDRQRANVKLLKSDGTELDLDGKVPLDAGSSSKSPVRVEGAPSSEFQAGSTLLKDFAGELPNLDERFLDGRINNKEDLSFLERETVVDRVLAEMNKTIETKGLYKPRLVALWSPRGTGKTSLVRHLAQSKQYADSRRCGRLLVFDGLELEQHLCTDADTLVSAIIIWHLLQIFHDYTVEVAPGQNVLFERRDFGPVLQLLEQSRSTPTPSGDSVLSWIASCCKSRNDVLNQWLSITEKALAAPKDCPRLFLLDQAELLASESTGQSREGGIKSTLTDICSRLPQQMACFCTGTLNVIKNRPHVQYTKLVVCSLAALAPLSRDATDLAMKDWNGTQYEENVLNQIVLFSGGVPRLLRYASETSGVLRSTAQTALNEMSRCLGESYGSAVPFFSDPVIASSLVLCSAVRWPTADTGRYSTVPGTSTAWSEIFNAGAAFPAANNSVQVPRVWWCFDQAVRQQLQGELKALNIRLDRLLPDSLQLVASNNRGNVARGKPWEELVAHSLAARFHLYCMQHNWTANNTWAPFLEIYPTDNAHLKKCLEPFEVCWKDGVSYPQSEASVSNAAGHAILCNVPFRNAHHDLLIPVKRVKCGTCEYIAAQCRYGAKKTAKDLNETSQDKARKPKKNEARDTLPDMPNVLLQICPETEGAQPFKAGTSWAKRQSEYRYSLMSCKSIIAQLDVLRLL